MANFSKSSRNIALNGSILSAECRTPTGAWQLSALDLDDHLENSDGAFEWEGTNFSYSAQDVHLEDTMLFARLCMNCGQYPIAWVNLDTHIANAQGHLEYTPKPIGFSHSSRNIVLDRTVLRAECLTLTGEWEQSMINLNAYLGCRLGEFRWKERNFRRDAEDIRLDGSLLYARLQDGKGGYRNACVDLNECIFNHRGYLKFWTRPAGFYNTSRNVEIQGSILRAECRRAGEWHASMIDLDDCLGNVFGRFQFGHEDFSLSARDICLEGSVLHAKLGDANGSYRTASVDLNNRITEEQGHLKYLTYEHATRNPGRHNGMLSEVREILPDLIDAEARIKRDYNEPAVQEARRTAQRAAAHGKSLYKHSPLAKNSCIRLVKILPSGDRPDVVKCEIVEADLADHPKFVGLSYTWDKPFDALSIQGDYQRPMMILCNGEPFLVNQNLNDALRRLRRKKKSEDHEVDRDILQQTLNTSVVGVENLLRQGVDVNVQDEHGHSALHYAALYGLIDIIKALVFAGGDINLTCVNESTVVDHAYPEEDDRHRGWEFVQNFLEEQENVEHARQGGNTCLRADVTEVEYLWIDAICINQEDEHEKSSQVAMMGSIYRAADSVIVWLGREFQDHQDRTEDLLQGTWRLEYARENGTIPDEYLQRLTGCGDWLNSIGLTNVEKWFMNLPIFRRQWFERAWIVQEVLMAKNLTVVCGEYILPWDIFIFMSATIECCRLLIAQGNLFSAFGSTDELIDTKFARGAMLLGSKAKRDEVPAVSIERWRRSYQNGNRIPTLAALSISRNQEATNPRDKVFCVLSFATVERVTRQGLRNVKPDYTQTTKQLFIEVGKSLLAQYGPCALSFSGMCSSLRSEDLPSWVPDLRTPHHARSRGIDISNTQVSDEHMNTVKFDTEEDTYQTPLLRITSRDELFVNGYIWDTISDMAHPGLNDIGKELTGLSRWVEMLSKLKGTPKEKRYVLQRTLVEDPMTKGKPTTGLKDHQFRDWLDFLCFSSILGHQEHFRASVHDFSPPNIFHHEESQRPQSQIISALESAQTSLTALGIPLSTDTMKRWSDPHTYSSKNQNNFQEYYVRMITPHAIKYGQAVQRNDSARRLMRTARKNTLGTGPLEAQAGDAIVIIDGANVPYVFRNYDGERYELVGEAYLYRFDMQQVLSDLKAQGKLESICIV